MGAKFTQLTDEERIEIYALLKAKISKREIARRLKRDPKTIREEVARNAGLRGYRAKQAHAKALERRKKPRRSSKMAPPVVAFVEAKLREDLSPEQIAAVMPEEILTSVSHETIYQHILTDQKNGGDLWRHLRLIARKKRRKRYGKKDTRGRIPGRVDIEDRPAEVEQRNRIGHWEADLVSGKNHRGFLVTLVERTSRFVLVGHVPHKNAEAVTAEITRVLQPHAELVQTLTFDNGREFAGHETLAQTLQCQTYFAKPYHSWERGTNENTNGLLRQYFPKAMDLRDVPQSDLNFAMQRLNNRPRKVLGFLTPAKVFCQDTSPPGGGIRT